MKSTGALELLLTEGKFVVTGEIGPPRSAAASVIAAKVKLLKGFVDAANITDNQTAIARMSSLAAARICIDNGLEPIMQLTCRDRNRLALQSEALGAAALGIPNLLCLTGDHQHFGDHPQAKGVFDVDSIQLLNILKQLRDNGRFLSGEPVMDAPKQPGQTPSLFLGAAANPFGDPEPLRIIRLAKKVAAGADFIQTQPVFDFERFERWLRAINGLHLPETTYILAGVMPVKSYRALEYMRDNVPGMRIDPDLIARMKGAEKQQREGVSIAVELIERLKSLPGIHGIHIMAVEWESVIPTIVERANLLPRRNHESGADSAGN